MEAQTPCPACGEPLQARDRYCEACGHSLLQKGDANSPAPGAQPPSAVPTAGCGDCGSSAISADGFCESCGLRQPSGRERVEIELADPGPVRAAAVSDRGLRRPRNEDAVAMATVTRTVQPGGPRIDAARGRPEAQAVCAVLCDGVASAPGSEEAALVAAETGAAVLARRLAAGSDPEDATRAAVARAGHAVAGLSASPHNPPACTYVSAIVGDETVTIGWVGDSRAYWLATAPPPDPDARPAPAPPPAPDAGPAPSPAPDDTRASAGDPDAGALLTLDDSWAVRMVARNAMTEADAWADPRAHLLTAWLGADADGIDPHATTFAPGGPGLVVVCSDGLWNHLPEPEALAGVLAAGPDASEDPLAAARGLVQAALDAGGHDNVTVALIPFPPPPPIAPAEPTREPLA